MKVQIEFECGEKTCASEPGEFCRFLGAKKMGLRPVCLLFRDRRGEEQRLFEEGGWLQRCPECLALSC